MSEATVISDSARRGYLRAPGPLGAIGDFRLAAAKFEVRRIDAPSVTALIVNLERDFPISGAWYSTEAHYFDMSFIPRPAGSRGCFEGVFEDRQSYGKVFIAPAGYRLCGEGPAGCRQHSLNVFVQARPLFADEAELGDALAPILRECLRLKVDAVSRILERIATEVSEPRFASAVMVEGLGLMLLAEAGRALQSRVEAIPRMGGLPLWRLKIIEERVRDGPPLPSIAALAGLCGLSRRQLTRAFRDETGGTLSAFIARHTTERAKRLLLETELSIAQVGEAVGFASPSAFGAAFRRATGQNPRTFRARRRSDGQAPRDPALH